MKYITDKIILNKNSELKSKKNIILCADRNYMKYVGITMTSILMHSDKQVAFHIFGDEISEADLKKFKNIAEAEDVYIAIYLIDKDVLQKLPKNIKTNRHISIAAYFRIIAYAVLAETINYVLYMDCDILVKGKLDAFWNYTMNSKITALVVQDNSEEQNAQRVGTARYFNSGVMFVNLTEWKKNNFTERSLKMISEQDWPFLDQDVLNVLLNNKIVFLNTEYNYQYSLSKLIDDSPCPSKEKLREDAVIVHYIGASKPWHTWVQCCQGAKAWVAVKQNSMWNDVKLSGPETIKNHTYKYWHKFARVAKKEGHWSDMFKYYWNYCCSKVLGK